MIFMIFVFIFVILMFSFTTNIAMKYPKVYQCDLVLH